MAPSGKSAVQRAGMLAQHFRAASSAAPSQADDLTGEASVIFTSELAGRTFKLNRPTKLNALNEEMIDRLRPKIEEWNTANRCKVIIGTGEGRAFCAGGDVATVVQNAAKEETRHLALQFFRKEFELDYLLASLEKSYVAIMDGITMGGGVGLSIQAPFRIATEKTVFAMPETKIGYSPDVGASFFLSRLDGEIGTYLGLTGATVQGRAVFECGLATHFVPSRRVQALRERLASLEEGTPTMIDRTIEEFYEAPTSDESFSGPFTGPIREAIDLAFAHNKVEGIYSTLEKLASLAKEESVQAWAKTTLTELDARSPTSLKVALEAIRRGKKMPLSEALDMELRIATAFCSGASPDFQTGVTAVLISKSPERPAWSPSTLQEVSYDEILKSFFERSSPFTKGTPPLSLPIAPPTDPFRFALPKEADIESMVIGTHPTSGDKAVDEKTLVARFSALRGPKFGLKEKIAEVIARKCAKVPNLDGEGTSLKWKHHSLH